MKETERPVHKWRHFAGPALILFAAFVAIVPQLIRGNSCGHDFDVHLVSWLDCLNAWRHGIPYPHWTPSPNYGAGEPRFVFYPPLTWMLGAALGAILPWNLAPIVLTFLILAATGLATRALALEVLSNDGHDDLPATLAGCVAIFSGFSLFTAYERCAFPEFAGGFWLPLILLFALRDRSSSAPLLRRSFSGSTVPLALALAGAWLSNLPLGVIAGYLLAGVALLWAIVNKSWAPLLRAAVATVLGLGLAAIYWLPAALERHWVDIRQATEDPGYNFENNWLFARNANPLLALHDVILRQVSSIAVSMIAVALVSVLVCYFRNSLPKPKKLLRIPLAAIPVVVLFLLFPISRPVWHALPQMSFLQYPWRWLEAVEAPMSIFFVAAIWPSNRDSRNPRRSRLARILALAACAVIFVAATVYAGTTFFQVCYPEDTVASMLVGYRAGSGSEGMYEYEPPNGDDSAIATGLPDACLVNDPSIVLGKPDPDDPDANPAWAPDQNTCQATFTQVGGLQTNPEHRSFDAGIPHSGYLVLRLLRYPAWAIRLNGQLLTADPTATLTADQLAALPQRADGLIAVPVPSGPIRLTIDWTITRDVLYGRWLCGISLLLLACLWFYELRLGRTRLIK
ncbi:MAG: 6-pyruvoyl-tetrahydropterin synthase-related protein [Terracidiphilus sp.]